MYGYLIAQISVKDPEAYKDYVAEVTPTTKKFGGEYLVRGGRAESFEGEPAGDRHVIIRFPSFEKALAWYHSADYAPVKAKRMAASTSVQTIVEGI